MKKRFILNFFFLTFALIVINNNSNDIKGLSLITEHTTNEYIYTELKPLECLAKEKISSETDLFLDADNVVEVFNSQHNNQISLRKNDIDLMAKVVFAESKGEPFTGKVAVASVILNRVLSPKFPNSVDGVIKQKNAFSCVKNGKISVVPDKDSYKAVIDALKGNDPTSKALYFYNPKIATCSWMKGIKKDNVKSIGQHVFFNVK